LRILLVEDDPLIGDALQRGLRQEAFTADWVQTAHHAKSAIKVVNYQLLLLDLGLPDEDGLSFLKILRHSNKTLPVIILSARDNIKSRVDGLNLGADDYLVKPFVLEELMARIHAVMRRQAGNADPMLNHGEIQLDPQSHSFYYKGKIISLSAKEFALMHQMMMNPQKVISKEQLEESLYGWNEEISSNAIEVHIHHLRKKLDPEVIRTIRGVGYLLGASA
jgi:DNA-binding response OmpR family regulator